MAYLLGGGALVTAILALLVAFIAMRKVQGLTVKLVKAHVQGIRTNAARATMDMKVLTQKIEKMERAAAKALTKPTHADASAPY